MSLERATPKKCLMIHVIPHRSDADCELRWKVPQPTARNGVDPLGWNLKVKMEDEERRQAREDAELRKEMEMEKKAAEKKAAEKTAADN